jgi:hypothetical protein
VRKKKLLGWLIFAAVAAAVAAWVPLPQKETVTAERDAKAAERGQAPRAEGRLDALPARDAVGRPASPLFSSQSWEPPRRAVASEPAPVAAPVAPPMPYRVAGRVMNNGVTQIVLARGDGVLTVSEGDILDGTYKVERILADSVTLVYTPLDVREDLAVNSALAFDESRPARAAVAAAAPSPAGAGSSAQGPAQLRWEGPERVSAGSTFDVALRLTSAEAVRSAPLQLQYDAKVLEPVAVRAGGFFSDGLFSYRVNPAGSIFIGASGKGATALDAEFLVVRFKPIGGAGTAELKISSLSLQDAAGRAIATQQPAAFRTVITQ